MTEMLEYDEALDEFSGCVDWVWRLMRAVDKTPRGEWVSFSFKDVAGKGVNYFQFSYSCSTNVETFTVPKDQINSGVLDAEMVSLRRYFGLSQRTTLWDRECRFCKGRREMYVGGVLMDTIC